MALRDLPGRIRGARGRVVRQMGRPQLATRPESTPIERVQPICSAITVAGIIG
jgi:hypothetical protein